MKETIESHDKSQPNTFSEELYILLLNKWFYYLSSIAFQMVNFLDQDHQKGGTLGNAIQRLFIQIFQEYPVPSRHPFGSGPSLDFFQVHLLVPANHQGLL